MTVASHTASDDHEEGGAVMEDQVVLLDGISWELYEALVQARGESAVPRLTYLDGALELMTPGFPHESDKKSLARIVERWAEEKGRFLHGVGSWTVRKRKRKGGAEPDECYFVDKRALARRKRPDIAIEVMVSSRGLDKLEVWRRLRVPEVWIWRRTERLEFFVLEGDGYAQRDRSALLPDLDPVLVAACMAAPSQPEAIAALLIRLRGATSER
jgi:Uma2 family endonuclease